jgi:deoxyribonuclease V
MQLHHPHNWDLSPQEAIALQQSLRHAVILSDQLETVDRVAGVDVGFEDGGAITRAAVAVLSFPDLQLQDHKIARCPTTFPYILEALGKLSILPDLLLCDGQGIAHPRRFGIACHLGVLTNIPSIGVAKSLLVGNHGPVAEDKAAWQPLYDKGETIGAALRTRPKTKPLYISPGHRISLETAIAYVLHCTTKYRLPEEKMEVQQSSPLPPDEQLRLF